MNLRDWAANGRIVEQAWSMPEIADLMSAADRDMVDASVPALSTDWRLGIAYNAVLRLAAAALAACGSRVAHESHHYRLIQSLELTIGAQRKIIRRLDAFRKKRNTATYGKAGQVSDQEAGEMLVLAEELRRQVKSWLRRKCPDLLQE